MSNEELNTNWEQLALRLRPYIRRRVASDADTDDVLQEVLLRMYRSLSQLQDDDLFAPWMYRIARTTIADHLRGRQRHPVAIDSSAAADALSDDGAVFAEDDDKVAREVAAYLAFFVALLPSPYREAITLTELEGRTQQQAATMLGISLSGVKSRVQRGRAKLRQLLEACCEVAVDARGKVIACDLRDAGSSPSGCCE